MIDRLERLRHDAVVGRYHQHDDVGDFGAAGAHARERFVAGRIDEHDLAAVLLDVISADVLRDAAGFALGHVGGPDGIEQRSFAVIDVAHDGDHRGALHAIGGLLGLFDDSCVLSSSKLTLLVEAPKSRAISSAILASRFWLMVAKIFFSTSFLITRLALMPSFSESSFTVTPSEMVISRSMGGGAAASLRRVRHPQTTLFLFLIAMAVAAARLGLMTALLLGGQRRGRLGAQWRCRVQRPGPPEAAGGCAAARRTDSRPAHNRLARTNRTAIDRLARHGR